MAVTVIRLFKFVFIFVLRYLFMEIDQDSSPSVGNIVRQLSALIF
jgi:hypothetical protein